MSVAHDISCGWLLRCKDFLNCGCGSEAVLCPALYEADLVMTERLRVVRLIFFVLNPLSNGPAGWGIDVDENDRFVT